MSRIQTGAASLTNNSLEWRSHLNYYNEQLNGPPDGLWGLRVRTTWKGCFLDRHSSYSALDNQKDQWMERKGWYVNLAINLVPGQIKEGQEGYRDLTAWKRLLLNNYESLCRSRLVSFHEIRAP